MINSTKRSKIIVAIQYLTKEVMLKIKFKRTEIRYKFYNYYSWTASITPLELAWGIIK